MAADLDLAQEQMARIMAAHNRWSARVARLRQTAAELAGPEGADPELLEADSELVEAFSELAGADLEPAGADLEPAGAGLEPVGAGLEPVGPQVEESGAVVAALEAQVQRLAEALAVALQDLQQARASAAEWEAKARELGQKLGTERLAKGKQIMALRQRVTELELEAKQAGATPVG